jgi:hypothetical protein
MLMKDFADSIYSSVKFRLKNPILGGFILSWIVFNWRPILFIIISDKPIEDRFNYADNYLLNPWNGLVWPCCMSLIVFIVLPYVMAGLERLTDYGHSLRKAQRSRGIVKDIELEIARVATMQKLEDAKAKYLDRESLNKRIESLENDLSITGSQMQVYKEFEEFVSTMTKKMEISNAAISGVMEVMGYTTDTDFFGSYPADMQTRIYSWFVEVAHRIITYDRLSPINVSGARTLLLENKLALEVAEEKGLLKYSGEKGNDRWDISHWSVTSDGLKAIVESEKRELENYISHAVLLSSKT